MCIRDRPTSALDHISTNKMEELMVELKKQYAVGIAVSYTHLEVYKRQNISSR